MFVDRATRLIVSRTHFRECCNTFTSLVLSDTLPDLLDIPCYVVALDGRVVVYPCGDFAN